MKPIEEIEVGDKVLAYNEETGEQAYKEVLKLHINETHCWCTVCVKPENGEETFEIVSTPGHKYYIPNNMQKRGIGKRLEHIGYARLNEKWVSAEDLKFGDRVLFSNGTYGIIQSVEIKKLERSETTYNFEVEDFHTYFVGEERVLVHNADCGNNRGDKSGDKPYIEHNTYNDMRNAIGKNGADQFVNAMNKGSVGPKGQSGIKRLAGNGVKVGGNVYQYEVKVFGEFANYRLYGNYSDKFGRIVFSFFGKALH